MTTRANKKSRLQTNGLIKRLQDTRKTKETSSPTVFEEELKFYESNSETFYKESDSNQLEDPLLFYKHFNTNLPILTSIVKELYCLSATSVPVESFFSVAGFIQNEERNRLNPKNLEKLTFIKLNSNVLDDEN